MDAIVVNEEKLTFKHLPDFAAYLLREKLHEYVTLSLQFSREEQLPLLAALSRFPEDELISIATVSTTEILSALAQNKVYEHIRNNVSKFISDTLDVIDKDEVMAEDITLVAYIRRKAMCNFLSDYTSDRHLKSELICEIDTFTTQDELVVYGAYLRMQNQRLVQSHKNLEFQESLLLEAQEISEMGSYFIDYQNPENSIVSPQISKITGLSNFAASDEFFERVHPDDHDSCLDAWNKAFREGGSYDYIIRYNDGHSDKRLHSKGRVLSGNGKPINVRGTLRDITKEYTLITKLQQSEARQKHLNATLSKKNAELVSINHELESFNYIASHDLQEPLRKIQVYSGKLLDRDQTLSDESKESLSKVISSASRMQRLIADLIEFSQVSSTRDAFEPVDLSESVGEVVGMLTDRDSDAVFEISDLPTLHAIPFQISQLFTNIIGNALKYTRPGIAPKIRITSQMVSAEEIGPDVQADNKNFVRISICDNGIGFDGHHSENIFDLFKRLHSHDQYSGTGIGLAICKKIVSLHDGYITAKSADGDGACFNIYFPENRVVPAGNNRT